MLLRFRAFKSYRHEKKDDWTKWQKLVCQISHVLWTLSHLCKKPGAFLHCNQFTLEIIKALPCVLLAVGILKYT